VKYLLVVVLVLVVAWRWRSARDGAIATHKPDTDAKAGPMSMLACTRCGLHIPSQDAVMGRVGAYCSADHRAAAEP
jgi:uncharacterized protein